MLKIVSGGQTGVDRGALDAALDAGVECGGWCPAGRLAEDGRIPKRYPVTELIGAGYSERTAQNVADSDATLIISNGEPMGGTRETLERCNKAQKPYLVVDCEQIPEQQAIESAIAFLLSFSSPPDTSDPDEVIAEVSQRHPSAWQGRTVLNVAGPRASQWAEGHALTYQIVSAILRRISGQKGAN